MKVLVNKPSIKDYLKEVLSKHIEMIYIPVQEDSDGNATLASLEINMSITNKEGRHCNAATISIPGIKPNYIESIYSAWLGWRNERNAGNKPTLDLISYYDDLLIENGSWVDVEREIADRPWVDRYHFNFYQVDNRTFTLDENDWEKPSEIKGKIHYMVQRIEIFKPEVYVSMAEGLPDQQMQTLDIDEDTWYKLHLGTDLNLTVGKCWDELYEKYGITAEQADEIYEKNSRVCCSGLTE